MEKKPKTRDTVRDPDNEAHKTNAYRTTNDEQNLGRYLYSVHRTNCYSVHSTGYSTWKSTFLTRSPIQKAERLSTEVLSTGGPGFAGGGRSGNGGRPVMFYSPRFYQEPLQPLFSPCPKHNRTGDLQSCHQYLLPPTGS